jgi:fucose permease
MRALGLSAMPGARSSLALFFLIGISLSSLGPLLPLFEQQSGAGPSSSYLVISGYFGGSLLAMLALSRGRLAGSGAIRFAIVVYAAGCAGLFFSPDLRLSVLCACLSGFGAGLGSMNVNMAFARRRNGVALVNLVNAVFALGTVAGPLIASLSLRAGAAHGLLAVAVIALVCFGAAATATWPDEVSERRDNAERSGVPRRALTGFLLLYLCYGGVETGIGSWAAAHLVSQGNTAADAAVLVACFWGATAVSKAATVVFTRRWSAPVLVVGGLVGAAGGLVLAAVPHAAVIGYLVTGLALGPVFPTGLAWIAQAGGGTRLSGAAVLASMTGSIVFPAAISRLVVTGHIAALPLLIAIVALGGAAAGAATRAARTSRAVPPANPH